MDRSNQMPVRAHGQVETGIADADAEQEARCLAQGTLVVNVVTARNLGGGADSARPLAIPHPRRQRSSERVCVERERERVT